ncbi:MAG TPA: hypothetical protein VJ183_18940 [Chloroflexia bacterium]|nr:hypothetical protein [Chloroflexia bacterium]
MHKIVSYKHGTFSRRVTTPQGFIAYIKVNTQVGRQPPFVLVLWIGKAPTINTKYGNP